MQTVIHREDVKAAIRIKHGSLESFADAHDLTSQSVRDLLRGKSNRAKAHVASLLGVDPDQLTITDHSTDVDSSSTGSNASHRLNAAAR
jgi:lambda repressor-like predicted transcriptional regulator